MARIGVLIDQMKPQRRQFQARRGGRDFGPPPGMPGRLIVAHNINAGQADPQYLEAITGNPDLETVFYQQGGGVSVTMKKHLQP